MDSFANAPVSLAETRAMREDNARLWTPRDALVSLLRDIDAGKVDPYAIVIAYGCREDAAAGVSTHSLVAGGNPPELVGIASLTLARLRGQD